MIGTRKGKAGGAARPTGGWLRVALLLLAGAGAARPAVGDVGGRLAAVDAQARAAPASSAMSVESLALYLRQRTRDERERARGAFSWIAHNIGYDASLRHEKADPSVVLARRRAACHGYAVLFEALGEAMGLEVEVVGGHGKGRGYQPGQGMESTLDHAWNAVKIDGRWRLVDCTWGAGYVDDQGRYVRRFTDHYFLTPPEEFAYDHFPDDPRWQLLPRPISQAEYLDRVHVKPPFFELGLRLVSHRSVRIETGGELEVRIGAPRETVVTAALYQAGRQLPKHYTFTQREGEFVVRAAFPSRGSYLLRVFARRREAVGEEYETALNYAVQARAGGGAGFPEVYDSFLVRECRLEQPLGREIPAGKKVRFALSAPKAEEMVVVRSDEVWWVLGRQGEWFSGEVLTEAGEVTVFAKFPGKSRYEGLLRYGVR